MLSITLINVNRAFLGAGHCSCQGYKHGGWFLLSAHWIWDYCATLEFSKIELIELGTGVCGDVINQY